MFTLRLPPLFNRNFCSVSEAFGENYRYSVDIAALQSKMTERRPWIRCSGFFKALEERDAGAVNSLLDAGFDIDTYLMYRKTAISFCVLNAWYDMAELLVKRGCSLSLKSENGETPLHMAVLKANYDLVKLLLRYRADVTSIDLLHKTALHYACQMNNLKIAALLIENMTSASINVMDKDKRTPLFYACQYGCSSMISSILAKGAKVNMIDSHGNTPLLHCMVNLQCTSEIVNLLLVAGADVNHSNVFNETALLIAIRMCTNKSAYENFLDVCRVLIEYGCDLNAKNCLRETPLHLAVILKEEALVHKLLNYGCSINETNSIGLVPLYYACSKGYEKIARLLIDAGADFKTFSESDMRSFMVRNDPTIDHMFVIKVQEELKKCPSLSSLCRTAIRQNLPSNIEKSASVLPLPQFLIKFIQLY